MLEVSFRLKAVCSEFAALQCGLDESWAKAEGMNYTRVSKLLAIELRKTSATLVLAGDPDQPAVFCLVRTMVAVKLNEEAPRRYLPLPPDHSWLDLHSRSLSLWDPPGPPSFENRLEGRSGGQRYACGLPEFLQPAHCLAGGIFDRIH